VKVLLIILHDTRCPFDLNSVATPKVILRIERGSESRSILKVEHPQHFHFFKTNNFESRRHLINKQSNVWKLQGSYESGNDQYIVRRRFTKVTLTQDRSPTNLKTFYFELFRYWLFPSILSIVYTKCVYFFNCMMQLTDLVEWIRLEETKELSEQTRSCSRSGELAFKSGVFAIYRVTGWYVLESKRWARFRAACSGNSNVNLCTLAINTIFSIFLKSWKW
jgi:hypothetical protein